MIKNPAKIRPSKSNTYITCQRSSGGTSIFVKSSYPQRHIDLSTELQAAAVSVTLDKEITICSVYIPPSFSLTSEHLNSLIQQLPTPYLLLGDFNGHNILWGNKENNSRGELIENIITNNDICLMNDKSYTYMHDPTGSFSSIDLSLCHPSIFFLTLTGPFVTISIIVIIFLSSLKVIIPQWKIIIQNGN